MIQTTFYCLVGNRVPLTMFQDKFQVGHIVTQAVPNRRLGAMIHGDSMYVYTYLRTIGVTARGSVQTVTNDGPIIVRWDPDQHRKEKLKGFLQEHELWDEDMFGCWTFATNE